MVDLKLGCKFRRMFGFRARKKDGADRGTVPVSRDDRLAPSVAGCHARHMLTVYVYQKCSTCRDALKWLDEKGVGYQVKAIRETPPSPAELKCALDAFGGDLRKIFNTSGMDYRALGLKDQLPTMSESTAFGMLSKNGNLVKRPFLIGQGKVLVGFKADQWQATLV
jgi:arsenate reductase